MRGFKHIPAEFADAFRAGESIKIGNFRYYRSMEGPRADPYEGLAVSAPGPIIRAYVDPERPSDPNFRALKSLGINVEAAAPNTTVIGTVFTRSVPEAYLFCCSSAPDLSLLDEGQSIFEIADLREFGRELERVEPTFLGTPKISAVSYQQRRVDTLIAETPIPDPFVKSPHCAHEKEIRIMWRLPDVSREAALSPFLLLRCPAVANLITPIKT